MHYAGDMSLWPDPTGKLVGFSGAATDPSQPPVPGVTRLPALWSADFPRPLRARPRSPDPPGLLPSYPDQNRLSIGAKLFWTKSLTSGRIISREYGRSQKSRRGRCGVKLVVEFVLLNGDKALANIKSAIKRNKQNEKRRVRNRVFRGRARTFVKKAHLALAEQNLDDARQATLEAISVLDKAAEKGVLHKNNAARRKSRLMHRLAKLEKEAA